MPSPPAAPKASPAKSARLDQTRSELYAIASFLIGTGRIRLADYLELRPRLKRTRRKRTTR